MIRPLLPFLLLSACATGDGDYPSLALRPAERLGFDEPAAPAPEPVKADPALDRRVAAARGALAKARQAFDAAAGRADRLVKAARGTAVGSDRWIAAQAALADLDALRADTGAVVTTLDGEAADRAGKLLPDDPALEQARSDAAAASGAQDARIAALSARLPGA